MGRAHTWAEAVTAACAGTLIPLNMRFDERSSGGIALFLLIPSLPLENRRGD